MDLLLSVPEATYFLGPTTFAGSINILFFYMTWSTLVWSHPPLVVHLIGVLAIRLLFGLIPGLISLLLDGALPSVIENIKYGGRSALPPTDSVGVLKVVGLSALNVVLMVALEAGASLLFTLAFRHPEFTTRSTLPLPWYMAKHILMLFAAREVVLYYIHRHLLHGESNSRIVKWLSARHQSWAHARAGPPYILQAYTDYPVTFLLHRFVPVYLPALILRPHLLTYFFFLMLCTGEETLSMSGYTIVPGIIMGGMAQRSAVHYASAGEANYGAWGLLDWMHGTAMGKNVLEDVKAEAEKHHLEERAKRKAIGGVKALQNGVDALSGDSSEEPRKSGRKRSGSRKTKTN